MAVGGHTIDLALFLLGQSEHPFFGHGERPERRKHWCYLYMLLCNTITAFTEAQKLLDGKIPIG